MDIKNELYFSPKFKLSDLDKTNVIEAFKERIDKWYFEPINILNKKKFGFSATALLASLIDILAKTKNHDTTNSNNRSKYTEWLKKNFGFTEKKALNFYENFRCGLLHSGCIEYGGYISYKQKQFCVSIKGSLILNPKLLFQEVKKKFDEFINNEDPEQLFEYLKGKLNEID